MQRVWYIASFVLIASISLILLIVQPFPILHDYPEWMFQGYVVSKLTFGEVSTGFDSYRMLWVPVPNAISQWSIALLNTLTGPVMAGKVWLALYFLGCAIVSFQATRDRAGSGALQFILLVTIFLGPGFWNGYINFQIGLLLLALFVTFKLGRSVVWVFVFSLLIYFSHASTFAGFVCLVVISEIQQRTRRPAVVAALLPSLGLLLWYIFSNPVKGSGGNVWLESPVQWLQYKVYTLAKQGPFHNFIRPDGESLLADFHAIYQSGFVLNFVVGALLGIWLMVVFWKYLRHKSIAVPVVLSGAALIVLWLLAGKNSFGVVNLGERFLIIALLLVLLTECCPTMLRNSIAICCTVGAAVTVTSLFAISQNGVADYSVDRSAETTQLENFVQDIYQNSRHKYFNHRLFIYANLGTYLLEPEGPLPPIDHETSVIEMVKSRATQ